MSTAIVWFRRDLRLADNPALTAALRMHDAVLPVYVHAPEEEAPWQPGAASRWWLHHSLTALAADGLAIVDVSTRDPDLEDVFLSLVSSDQEAA